LKVKTFVAEKDFRDFLQKEFLNNED